jgi:hypothetical protein
MDELIVLRSFRDAVRDEDGTARERVRRGLHRSRRRRVSRVWIVVAVVLVGAAVVSSAFGWTLRLFDAIAGEPAPTSVRKAFAIRDAARPRQFPIFRESPAMEVVEEKAHAVLGLDTSAGRVIVWSAPTKGGGRCLMIDIVALRRSDGAPAAGGGCSPSPLPPEIPAVFGVSGTRIGDRYLELVRGEVSVGVASVELRYPDGRRETLPVFERFFLSELRDGMRPTVMITRDANGAEIKRRHASPPLRVGPGSIPKPVGPERELIRLETSAGYPLTFSLAPAEGGQVCQITRYRGSVGRTCGRDPRMRVAAKEAQVHPGLWNEAQDGKPLVSLSGVVGSEIARLEIHYVDGTTAQVPIHDQFVYFEIPPSHHEDRRFVLVGRDRRGVEISRRVVK